MNKIVLIGLILAVALCSGAEAARIEKNVKVAVMDFGTHKGAATQEIKVANLGRAACDYVIQGLIESGCFRVADRALIQDQFDAEGIKTEGIIDPDTAQLISDKMQVNYIVYGNVTDLSASDMTTEILANGVKVYTVTAHIIARIMDISTGEILMASKGEGKSKSSFTKVGSPHVGYFSIGTKKVTQDSVHNAVQKASYAAVDQLVERLYGIKPKPRKK